MTQMLQQAMVAHQQGRLAEAEAQYRQILAAAPHYQAQYLLALALFQQRRLTEAAAATEELLAQNPAATGGLMLQGVIAQALGRREQALAAFTAVTAREPVHAEAWHNQGVALSELGRKGEAVRAFDRALTLKPTPAAWTLRGHALTELARFQEAVASYDQAVRLGQGSEIVEALLGRADVKRHRQRFAEALADYDRAFALAPPAALDLANHAASLQMLWRFEEALASIEKALALAPDHPHALAVKGSLMCEMGRFGEGMASYARRAALMGEKPAGDEPPFKMRHDAEQRSWLAERGVTAAGFHVEGGARLAGPAINPDNARTIAARWAQSDPKLVVIDNLLTPEALAGLRDFALGSTIWKRPYDNGYLGAMPDHGFAAPLLAQIAEEMGQVFPTIFGRHGLCQWWGFKYDSGMAGIRLHADLAIVNVNFWITPDSANLNPANGGLVVWDCKPPADWDFARANGDDEAGRELLRQTGAKPVTIPYRANRAVIFDSDLFHETDAIEFAPGYENRRINVTMLFGRR